MSEAVTLGEWIRDSIWPRQDADLSGARKKPFKIPVTLMVFGVCISAVASVGVSMLVKTPQSVSVISTGSGSKHYDALAVALTAQSNAIAAQSNYLTFATLILAVIALLFALTWGYVLRLIAERSAREAVNDWMQREGFRFISETLAQITPDTKDGGNSDKLGLSQEQQENALEGEDPRA